MLFQSLRPGPFRVPGIQNLYDNIRRIQNFMQLIPNSFALACRHTFISILVAFAFLCDQVVIVFGIILFVFDLLDQLIEAKIV